MSNVTLPPQGAGDSTPKVATDLIASEHHQLMKLEDGTPGSTNKAIVNADGEQSISVDDLAAALINAIKNVIDPLCIDPVTGRLRISLDNIAAALTLATITTVSTVTTCTTCSTVTKASQLGSLGIDASGLVFDSMDAAWGQCVRGRIS